MDYLQQMEVLVKVADEGSFARAAQRLGYSAPTVTRAIAALESRIGTRILIRNTRGIRLSDAGVRYLRHVRNILNEVTQAERTALGVHGRPQGTLCVTMPVMFGLKHVVPVVDEYLDLFPEVSAEVRLSDDVANLTESGVDIAVRIGHLPSTSFIASQVGSVRVILVASADYLDSAAALAHPYDLARHRIIAAEVSVYSNLWQFLSADGPLALRMTPSVRVNHSAAAISLAVAGQGIARVLSYQVTDELSSGALRILLRDFEPAPLPVNVLNTEGRDPSAKIRKFVDLSVQRLRERLRAVNGEP